MFVRHSRSLPGALFAILAIALSLSLPLAVHAQDVDADLEFRMGLAGTGPQDAASLVIASGAMAILFGAGAHLARHHRAR